MGDELKLNISENAGKVLEKRYLKKDADGNVVETPAEMFRRVAGNIAQADFNYDKKTDMKRTEEEFYSLISKLEFLPNSPTLMNAGKELQQLSACFVLPIRDSMEGIFDSLKSAALIHKSGGGTGFSFSNLRPKSSVVRSTGG
ncbi:MAG: ribonucleotide reductase N-terminal alpha domain-containing protein, partial [Candidatus Omnitrophica bacterium]|nr:ribonucleotide reductase N-terminal alpha domain-containing protein [Candidatus Omnitrophota bacterium]